MRRVRLTKVTLKAVFHMKDALQYYMQLLSNITDRGLLCNASIAHELWYDLHHRTERRNPPVNNSFDLPLHKGCVLLEALVQYAENTMVPNHLTNTHLSLTQAVDQQLP